MKRIAQLTEEFGDKRLFFTQRQNIEIHGVKPEKVESLSGRLKRLDSRPKGFSVSKTWLPV